MSHRSHGQPTPLYSTCEFKPSLIVVGAVCAGSLDALGASTVVTGEVFRICTWLGEHHCVTLVSRVLVCLLSLQLSSLLPSTPLLFFSVHYSQYNLLPRRHHAADHREGSRQAGHGGVLFDQHRPLGISVHRTGTLLGFGVVSLSASVVSFLRTTVMAMVIVIYISMRAKYRALGVNE